MDLEFSVSEFVAVLNQTLEFAYPSVTITGELSNLRVSKGKWLYFDLKDESSSVKFFGTVYHLPGPLEDGMLVKVRAVPRLHNLYGFSMNVQSIQPAGEGSIRKAAALLQAKLQAEGLFEDSRKRQLPYPPSRICLITSAQSAAYADFIKIMQARWSGVAMSLIDVQVQGEPAVNQIVGALKTANDQARPAEVIVVIRGGGSADDLAAFSSEQVTRAIAASRIPTLVAIGHEIDVSLAELAADCRASTPSNAAELLVPDKKQVLGSLHDARKQLDYYVTQTVKTKQLQLRQNFLDLGQAWDQLLESSIKQLHLKKQLLEAYSPQKALARGYAIIRVESTIVSSVLQVKKDQAIALEFQDGFAKAEIREVIVNENRETKG